MTEDIRLFPEQDIAAKLDAACKQQLAERRNSMCNYSEYIYEKGIEKGIFSTLYSLVGERLLSIEDAASRVNMTSEEFRKKMMAYTASPQTAK